MGPGWWPWFLGEIYGTSSWSSLKILGKLWQTRRNPGIPFCFGMMFSNMPYFRNMLYRQTIFIMINSRRCGISWDGSRGWQGNFHPRVRNDRRKNLMKVVKISLNPPVNHHQSSLSRWKLPFGIIWVGHARVCPIFKHTPYGEPAFTNEGNLSQSQNLGFPAPFTLTAPGRLCIILESSVELGVIPFSNKPRKKMEIWPIKIGYVAREKEYNEYNKPPAGFYQPKWGNKNCMAIEILLWGQNDGFNGMGDGTLPQNCDLFMFIPGKHSFCVYIPWISLDDMGISKLWVHANLFTHTEVFTLRNFYTQTLLHTDIFTHRRFYTQTVLHTDAFTHRSFYTDAFTHKSFYTQKFLHTDAFTHRCFYTQTLLHTNAFTHRRFYTQTLLHTDAFAHRRFYTQTLSHTDTFAHKSFYTQTLLYSSTFTHRRFYTQTLLHTDAFTHRRFYTQTLLHTDAFTHKHFDTHTLLHTNAFTHKHFYTQTLLHTEAFTQTLLHTDAFTHRRFYTETLLHTGHRNLL